MALLISDEICPGVFHRELTSLQTIVLGAGGSQCRSFLLLGSCCLGAILEALAIIAGLENVATMGEPPEERGSHLVIAEQRSSEGATGSSPLA